MVWASGERRASVRFQATAYGAGGECALIEIHALSRTTAFGRVLLKVELPCAPADCWSAFVLQLLVLMLMLLVVVVAALAYMLACAVTNMITFGRTSTSDARLFNTTFLPATGIPVTVLSARHAMRFTLASRLPLLPSLITVGFTAAE